ncbi:MAG: porin [Gammaproteobacteria bacterium]|nr:porin [Gammaproteobacteria bacterium]
MNKVIVAGLALGGLVAPLQLMAAEDIENLQKEVRALKKQNRMIMERLDATVDMVEKSGKAGPSKTRIGGYGELHYNNLSNSKPGEKDKKEIDLHRFILFVGHEISPDIRFWSELEVEHAKSDKNGGEVAIEQAYLEFDISSNLMSRAGVMLVPVGIINETHEPPTFYGVERNNVEKYIIPTTWREGGVSLNGRSGGLSYDLAVHSGLQTTAADDYAIRDGRKAVRQAPADKPAYTARLKYTGVAGLELAASLQQQTDITQNTDGTAGAATLVETHLAWQAGPFTLRALYASWNLDGKGPKSVGADEQTGWYVEPSFKFSSKLGVFVRQSSWDNQVGNAVDTEYRQLDVGFNYWPHPDVVIKADYQTQDAPKGKNEYEGFNLGLGYQF